MKNILNLFGIICLSLTISFISCEKNDDEKDETVNKSTSGLPTVITGETCEVKPISTLITGDCTAEGGSKVTLKGIIWHTSSDLTFENKTAWSNHGAGIGSFKSSLTNLTPLTTYYYRAYATNGQGTGYGEVKSFKTPK